MKIAVLLALVGLSLGEYRTVLGGVGDNEDCCTVGVGWAQLG